MKLIAYIKKIKIFFQEVLLMNFLFLKSDIPFNPYSKKVKKKGGGGQDGY